MMNFSRKFLFGFIIVISLTLVFFFCFFNIRTAEAATFVTNNIETDTIWRKENSPYVIQNSIEVSLGAKLTIEKGVIVKFDPSINANLNIYGDLIVDGEADDKVYFTSYYDDSIGGDTNEDYYCDQYFDDEGNLVDEYCDTAYYPDIEDWQSINFVDSHNNYLNNVVFKYASNPIFGYYAYLNLKNIEIIDSGDAIIAYNSNIDSDKTDCLKLSGSCLIAFSDSNINLANSIIDQVDSDAIDIYNDSHLNILNTVIKNINSNYSAVSVFINSSISANGLNILNGGDRLDDYISVFNHSNLSLNNSSLIDCRGYACIQIFDAWNYIDKPSNFDIENSTISNGVGDGIVVFGDSVIGGEIHNSKIKNFAGFSINTWGDSIKNINAENNYWGDASGPFHPIKNPDGIAGAVGDGVEFIPWCKDEVCKARNPVIIVPGIMGTQIFKDYNDSDEIWPNIDKLILSITDNHMDDLALLSDGSEDFLKPVKIGDIVREVKVDFLSYKYESHIFDKLINLLKLNRYIEGENLFVFPYDWRKSNAESAKKLKEKINAVLLETNASKVDIVAHSMGGLVAKKYIADNGGDKIDNLIFIGTPHLGAPKAFKALMYGDDMGVRISSLSLLSTNKVKDISQNMPAIFELLPSRKYVDGEGEFIGEKYVKDVSGKDLSYMDTAKLMIRDGRNYSMFNFAEDLHNNVDDLDLSNVKVSNFVGCGETKTIGKIVLKKKRAWTSLWTKLVDTFDLKYVNGDDTVPVRSADLKTDNKYYVKGSTHGELPSADGLREDVVAILSGRNIPIFFNVSDTVKSCYVSGKVLSFVSYVDTMEPMDVHIYDKEGNHTGPIVKETTDEKGAIVSKKQIEYGIKNIQYDQIGGNTYVFIPKSGGYRVVSNVTNNQVHGVSIQNVNSEDAITGSAQYNNISPTMNSQEVIEIPESSFVDAITKENVPSINIDENNDGIFETQILPDTILSENEVGDVVAPNTVSEISGNMLYLFATDDNSGVENILYSLDDGDTWINYKDPINLDTVSNNIDSTVKYLSIDKAGNTEEVRSVAMPVKVQNVSSGGYIKRNTEKILSDIEKIVDPKSIQDVILHSSPIKQKLNSTIGNIEMGMKKPLFVKTEKKDNTILTAQALDSGFKFKKVYAIYILSGLIIVLLIAKRIIKL